MVRIGFLGAGKMAQALVTGFLKSSKLHIMPIYVIH